MKRLLIFGGLVIGIFLTVAACRKDVPYTPGSGEVVGTDDESYLLTNLVFTDEDYNITGYMTGLGLDEADPGAVSIPGETLEQAQEIFRSWIPDGSDSFQNGDSVIWNLKDPSGASQGQAVLAPGGGKGAVAHLELPKDFPAVTSVRFLPKAALPENGERDLFEGLDEFYFLNTVAYGGYVGAKSFHGSGYFVVIREYEEDTNTAGIIMYCRAQERNIWWDPVSASEHKRDVEQCRKLDEMRIVRGAYVPYASIIDKALRSLPDGDDANDKYLCFKRGDDSQQYRFNFREWEPEKVNAFQPTYQHAFIYFFTVEKKKNGEGYQLVFN